MTAEEGHQSLTLIANVAAHHRRVYLEVVDAFKLVQFEKAGIHRLRNGSFYRVARRSGTFFPIDEATVDVMKAVGRLGLRASQLLPAS